MKVIIIYGPTGSGKTSLSRTILRKIQHGIILSTDNYYKTGLLSKFFSKFIDSYFDRRISFNYKLFKKDLNFIIKKGRTKHEYLYDFRNKTKKKIIKEINNIEYLIIEGIFAKELLKILPQKDCFFIQLKTSKLSCLKRVLDRDTKERGKSYIDAENDFNKSWDLYYQNKNYNRPIKNSTEMIISTKFDFDLTLKKIANLMN